MKKTLVISLLALGMFTAGITGSQAQTINFDDLDLPGDSYTFMQTYSSQGFLLENSKTGINSDIAFAAPQKSNNFYFGNANLMITFPSEWAILTKPGGTFSLDSIDLHGFSDISNVEFFAYKGDASASQQFALNDLDSWHTVNFGPEFQNVDSVKWQQGESGYGYHTFDKIVLNNVVPEPVSCVLFGVGGLTLAGFRRFRKK